MENKTNHTDNKPLILKQNTKWTYIQQNIMLKLYQKYTNDWDRISIEIPNKSRQNIQKRFWKLKNINSQKFWAQKQTQQLLILYKLKNGDWNEISKSLIHFTPRQCYFQYLKRNTNLTKQQIIFNQQIKKRYKYKPKAWHWTFEQDQLLINYIHKYNLEWKYIYKEFCGMRSKGSVRERYRQLVRLSTKQAQRQWTPQQDALLTQLFHKYPYQWACISRRFANCDNYECYVRCRKLFYKKNDRKIVKDEDVMIIETKPKEVQQIVQGDLCIFEQSSVEQIQLLQKEPQIESIEPQQFESFEVGVNEMMTFQNNKNRTIDYVKAIQIVQIMQNDRKYDMLEVIEVTNDDTQIYIIQK